MRMIVPIKQVPETSAVKMDPETGTMIRDGLEAIINPLDLYAIEAALRLREQCGGEIVVLSMGPPKAAVALREAIAMGCDSGVLLSHKAFAGSDTWATSYVLAAAIRKLCSMGIPVRGPEGLPMVSSSEDGCTTAKGIDRRQGAYLPHWSRDGAIYAVTFRLGDSLPQTVLAEYLNQRNEILARIESQGREPTDEERDALTTLFSDKVERHLDTGYGACHLKDDQAAAVVADALKHFDGTRYRLLAWSVMPNHVHCVLQPLPEHTLQGIVHSLKSFTANEINRLLNRSGALWQTEYFDHLIRSERDLQHSTEYAWANPDAAGLADWKWRGKDKEEEEEETMGRPSGPLTGMPMPLHGQDGRATLVICGERATDGDTGQVGPGIAAWLDLPVVSYVSRIEPLDDGSCRVHRMVETGHEVLEASLPTVLTVVKEIADPRLPTLDGKLRAKDADIPTWTPAELDVDADRLGLGGSPTRVVKIFRPVVARTCRKVTATDDASIAQSVQELAAFLGQRELL